MKKAILYLSLAAVPALAQNPSVQWEKNVNGALSGYEIVNSSWKDPNGNFLITGTSTNDAYVLKVDNNGNQLAKMVYDGPQSGYDYGYVVKSDAAGNIYLGGITSFNSKSVPFIVKYNAAGTKMWEYVQSNVAVDGVITAIALDNYTSPTLLYFTGSKNDSSAITKINVNTGVSLWEKTLWPHGKMNDIDIDNNGHPLVCGYQAFAGVNADFYAAVLDISTGFPLRGCWRDGFAADSINDPNGHSDAAVKIKAGPAGTFVVFGTIYNNPTSATMYMAKFGSTGNVPAWEYLYDSPNHSEGTGIQLVTDAAFTNFYYLSTALSTGGVYYRYGIAGKVNNNGTGIWEQEFSLNGTSLEAHDLAMDANGNAHLLFESGYPGDLYYKKLASATGNVVSALQYDNQRGGGNAYDYAINLFLDNTSHPYLIGHSNALTYTNLDILLCRLNTNATLDWDLTYDFYVNSQDFIYNVQVAPSNGGDQIVACGKVLNNVTNNDVALTSYSENGTVNWQVIFDDNNGYDDIIGFEKSSGNNFFLCSQNNSSNLSTVTEFYPDGTTNFSLKTNWPFTPTCFKLDSAENGLAAGSGSNSTDFPVGNFQRNGPPLNNTPTAAPGFYASASAITTDNANMYVAGTIYEATQGNHVYVQKYDLACNLIWSTKIMGYDSISGSQVKKIVYDRASGAVYVIATTYAVGSTVTMMQLTKIDVNGNVVWSKGENLSDTRNEQPSDILVANGKIYITGFAYLVSSNDNMALTEVWNTAGVKQWEYVFDKVGIIDEGQSLRVDNAGNIFVGGRTNAVIFYNNSDMLLLKLNAAGSLIWEREYNGIGNGYDDCANIELSNNFSSNPRIYMGGNTQSTSGYYYDIGTLKYCDLPGATVTYGGSTSICQNSSMTLAASGTGTGNVTWAPGGQTGGAIVAATSGAYYFTYMESDGCAENSDTVTINIKGAPAPVQICMVTVDDSSKHNLIIWDKTLASPDVIGFNIYREDLTNIYHFVASVPVSSLSEYVDMDGNANPNSTTKRYKMTTVDSCGNESAMSNYHNTIYIVSSGGGQFSWNQLYTIENSPNPVVQYMLLRDDYNTNNWHIIDSTAGTQFNINDVNFSTFQPTANWRVVTQWNISCTPTARMANGNTIQTAIVKSKSNITNNRMVGIGTLNEKNVAAYPNPASNALTVTVPYAGKTTIKLTNLIGDEVYAGVITNGDSQQIDISKLASGTYLLQISNENGKFIKRIVKE